jgi:signal transduction histidine kinase/ligand-binding sensor domain-containing protein
LIRNVLQQGITHRSEGKSWSLLRLALLCAVVASSSILSVSRADSRILARTHENDSSTERPDSLPEKIPVVEGQDIRFRRLSKSAGLSQARVATVVQDKLGFIWFGTQYGLNRFDGYKSKVFKHEPGRSDSLSCVYIRSLFVDRSGSLWIGCDRFLDKFEPITETFAHYSIDAQVTGRFPTPIWQITEDVAGKLWLATDRGMYKFDPASGQTIRYVHNPTDKSSIGGNEINFTEENRAGQFWISNSGGLDEFDRSTGKVIRNIPFSSWVGRLHQDKYGIFWITSISAYCALATLNLQTNLVTCHSIHFKSHGMTVPVSISGILESREGTMWLGSSIGLLKLDREHKQFIRYHYHPSDNESLESDNVIFLYQDGEGNVWTCFQGTEPNYFTERPQAFENFTYQRGSLADPLVTSIYEDRNGILWIGSMGGLNRIDRQTGKNVVPPGTGVGSEILSILEDRSGVLFSGTFHQGLQKLDRDTGKLSPYERSRAQSNLDRNPIMRLVFDREGTLWAATYGGISRLDRTTGNFITYTPEKENTIQYQEIKEDSQGNLWLGAQSGLHRFDPRTGQFTIYAHDPDDLRSLSDNRVNSLHFDHSGGLWVGTQNGLDRFDQATGTFKAYNEQDGLAGDVVSCILEDDHGLLWMSTNNGLSSFDLHSHRFQNFSAADGLPGSDLTGWGACYQSPRGEMFFGGFSGATAFYPGRTANSPFVPRTVLTDFRLFGNPVPIGSGSPLVRSITYADTITLSQRQNIFSIEFSALSYFNPETNRYRYELEGLDDHWHEVGSDQRIASYTTLPVGTYIFHVEGATSRGNWSEPGATLRIIILPAWYQTFWFRGVCALLVLAILWLTYQLRLMQLHQQFHVAIEARVDERTRIARELHDTLLQSFNGLLLRFQAVSNLLPGRPQEAKQRIDSAIEQASNAITEGRDAVHELRSGGLMNLDLAQAIGNFATELLSQPTNETRPEFRVQVEGTPRDLNPIVRDEAYRIAAEALRNAIRHAMAREIEVEIRYNDHSLRLRIRDDGKGIEPAVLSKDHSVGHWGLRGLRERAKLVGGNLDVWSELDSGTEIELNIPAVNAYAKVPASRWFEFSRMWRP